MHNLDFMLQTLVNLALHYPQAGRTPAQLRILAEDWAEDLAAFPRDIVERAVKAHRRESPYFPTVADIWRRCEELRRGLEARREAERALPGEDADAGRADRPEYGLVRQNPCEPAGEDGAWETGRLRTRGVTRLRVRGLSRAGKRAAARWRKAVDAGAGGCGARRGMARAPGAAGALRNGEAEYGNKKEA